MSAALNIIQEPGRSSDSVLMEVCHDLFCGVQNDDGSTNWGLIVFIIQATACISVWAGLVATVGYYRFRRSAGSSRRQQFATAADSHLMTPLMYEPVSKGDHTAQLYSDLYPVEDAKLHADDRQYVAIQYVPLKSEV